MTAPRQSRLRSAAALSTCEGSVRNTAQYHFRGTAKSENREIRLLRAHDSLLIGRMAANSLFEERMLRGFHSHFPDGMPGVGLLLLRTAIAVRLMIQASSWIAQSQGASTGMWAPALLAFMAGILFMAGFLTRLTGMVSAVVVVAARLCHPAWDPSLTALFPFDMVVIATAISLLGPGAFSLDARFFGRRKVVIPRAANS